MGKYGIINILFVLLLVHFLKKWFLMVCSMTIGAYLEIEAKPPPKGV